VHQMNSGIAAMTNSGQFPVHGQTAVEMLINDHRVIKNLLEELTAAQAVDQRKNAIEQLKAILTIHNATEENLVYPALAVVAGKHRESEHLYHETAEADTMLFQLDSMLKDAQVAAFDETAAKFKTAVLEHIDDEENSALPHLKEHADPAQEQQLTAAVRELRDSLRFEMKDKG
jgi:hemerythrin superfamily protein